MNIRCECGEEFLTGEEYQEHLGDVTKRIGEVMRADYERDIDDIRVWTKQPDAKHWRDRYEAAEYNWGGEVEELNTEIDLLKDRIRRARQAALQIDRAWTKRGREKAFANLFKELDTGETS